MKSNKQIVCLSMHYWDDSWFRKQHFMSRFADHGYKVAYIEPTFPILYKPDLQGGGYKTNRIFSVSVEKKNDNLFIIKPPRGMRFWTNPAVSKWNHVYFAYRLQKTLKKLNFDDYILWIYQHLYAPGLHFFNYKELVYDITDDLAAYKANEPKKYDYINKCTEHLIGKSSLVIVTASTLFDRYKDKSKRISLVPNGYDAGLFSVKLEQKPEDLKEIPSPIIGFVGTLFSFLDYDLLAYIIKNNPDKSFVFIGNCEENSKKQWTDIMKHNNVFWLEKKRKEDIPAYLNYFDVCLNPFKVDDVSRSVSPLKVFEYLAMKKPVVSVKMESLEREEVAPFIYFASSYREFNEKLAVALKEKDMFKEKLDYTTVSKYSWDNLFKTVSESVNGL